MIFVLLIIVLAIVIKAAAYFLTKRSLRVVKFVGPRGTGKTRVLNALLGIRNRTVPTLESYSVVRNGVTIHDVVEGRGGFLEKYGIDDPSATYFFFMRGVDDLDGFPETKGFDIRFTYYGTCDDKKALERNVIVLNQDPAKIERYFS